MGSNRKDRNGRGKGEEKEGKESAGAATYAASSNIVCSFPSTTTMSKIPNDMRKNTRFEFILG